MTNNPTLYARQHKTMISGMSQIGLSIDDLRAIAAGLNDGKASLSKLPLEKRHTLIAHLQQLGARVRNPPVTDNVRTLRTISDDQRLMLDVLAAQIHWHVPTGYTLLCHKLIKAPRPRNNREVTKMRKVLVSLIEQQHAAHVEA